MVGGVLRFSFIYFVEKNLNLLFSRHVVVRYKRLNNYYGKRPPNTKLKHVGRRAFFSSELAMRQFTQPRGFNTIFVDLNTLKDAFNSNVDMSFPR